MEGWQSKGRPRFAKESEWRLFAVEALRLPGAGPSWLTRKTTTVPW